MTDDIQLPKPVKSLKRINRLSLDSSPILDVRDELGVEFDRLSLWDRGLANINLLIAGLVASYGCPGYSISLEDLKEEVAAIGESTPTLKSCLIESKGNFKRFWQASHAVKRSYAIAAAMPVIFMFLLNIASHSVLRSTKLRATWSLMYKRFTRDYDDPRWIRDCALDVRPLWLTWFSIFTPAIAIVLMFSHHTRTALNAIRPSKLSPESLGGSVGECLRLKQNIDHSTDSDQVPFYSSPWFTFVVLVPFLLGLPGLVCQWFYFHCGIDPLIGFPSHSKEFNMVIRTIEWYIYPLGWCLSALFFRSYFTFPLNFISTEYDIEIYPDMIKSLPIKGWFADFCTARNIHVADQMYWKDAISVEVGGLKPKADASQLSHEQPWLSTVAKVNSVYESLSTKLEIHTEYLEIKSAKRSLNIKLWELSHDEKIQLFQSIRKYAPSVYLDAQVQHALIGSSVLREPRYTQIWFSILGNGLGSALDTDLSGDLKDEHKLQNGRYTIQSKLASGGQAVTYKALRTDGEAAESVQVPIVLKEFQLSQGDALDVMIESARDFENESTILNQLSHPAIVKQMDMFYEDGRVYIVLEHIEGRSLRQVIAARGTLSVEEIIDLAGQMGEMLDYLHSQEPPVVHRDFTPDNIILQADGRLKLIDFSIAQRKDKTNPVESQDCAGKHSYTPPEQFRGEACPQSDIYALGATLFFLAEGRDPQALSQSRLSAGDEKRAQLSKIIEGATQLELARRYESVDWLMSELKMLGVSQAETDVAVDHQMPALGCNGGESDGAVIEVSSEVVKELA